MQNSDLSSGFKISSSYGVSQLYESVKDPGQRTEERRDIGRKCEKKKRTGNLQCTARYSESREEANSQHYR